MARATKPRVGRPSLGKGETVAVLIKLAPKDRTRWQAAARQRGVTLSEMVRAAVEAALSST